MNSIIEFEYSSWYIILCLLLGTGYSYLQYLKKSPWSVNINRALGVTRALLVSILAILLLGPTVITIKNFYEKPLIVIAIDNSESVALTTDSTTLSNLEINLGQIVNELQANGWQVEMVDITGEKISLDSLKFDNPRSNLTGMVKSIQADYEGANLNGILVISDGIFNSGFSPDLISVFTPIYSIGLGDTIPRKDLGIINVRHNKTVYQDNKYPVDISVRNEGLGPTSTKLKIYQGNVLLDQVQITISPESRLIENLFQIEASVPGKQRITIVLDSVEGESTVVNNRVSFYIDVVEGRQKVLIAADAPSPDIKALRLAIEQNVHFEVVVKINEEISDSDYDLIIFVQSPNRSMNRTAHQHFGSSEIPKLYLVGSQSNLRQLSRDGVLVLNQVSNQYDRVIAMLNSEFKGFTITSDMGEWLAEAPPLTVPFGNVILQPTDQVLMYQRIGTVTTERPIFYISNEEPKKGFIIGDGLWKWRLNEYKKYGETTRFDELITKIVMYLASKPDNRQFKLYPIKENYEIGEDIIFVAETYNELFEPIYGEPVNLKITLEGSSRNYAFTPLSGSKQIKVEDLPEGIYDYSAYTTLNGKRQQVSGQFSVEKPDLEAADLTADHIVLRKLSKESGGRFYNSNEVDGLRADFTGLEAPASIHSQEKVLLLINLPWIIILLITLITGEWLTRKMMGGY